MARLVELTKTHGSPIPMTATVSRYPIPTSPSWGADADRYDEYAGTSAGRVQSGTGRDPSVPNAVKLLVSFLTASYFRVRTGTRNAGRRWRGRYCADRRIALLPIAIRCRCGHRRNARSAGSGGDQTVDSSPPSHRYSPTIRVSPRRPPTRHTPRHHSTAATPRQDHPDSPPPDRMPGRGNAQANTIASATS